MKQGWKGDSSALLISKTSKHMATLYYKMKYPERVCHDIWVIHEEFAVWRGGAYFAQWAWASHWIQEIWTPESDVCKMRGRLPQTWKIGDLSITGSIWRHCSRNWGHDVNVTFIIRSFTASSKLQNFLKNSVSISSNYNVKFFGRLSSPMYSTRCRS